MGSALQSGNLRIAIHFILRRLPKPRYNAGRFSWVCTMIYRGWGIMTLVTPIAAILLLAYFFPHDGPKGNTPLSQVLLGAGLGAAVNVVLGLWLNRAPRQKGRPRPTISSSYPCSGPR